MQYAVPGLPVHCLVSSVVWGVEVRPPLGDFGRALFSQALLVLRGHPGVAPWLSHEELAKFEGGLGHELVPPGAVLRQGSPLELTLFKWHKSQCYRAEWACVCNAHEVRRKVVRSFDVWGKRRSARRLILD